MSRYRDESQADRADQRRRQERGPLALRGVLGRGRFVMATIMAGLAFFAYSGSRTMQAILPEGQIQLGPQHEKALGRKSFRRIETAYGGLANDLDMRETVDRIGNHLVLQNGLDREPYVFSFRVLADPQTVNAFAVPGGYIYVTTGLISQLQSQGEIAAILAHQISHLERRHGFDRLANTRLAEGQAGATVLASFLEPSGTPVIPATAIEELIHATVHLDYGQENERQADSDSIQYMAHAGYDPEAMIRAIKAVRYTPEFKETEFVGTHPNMERRLEWIAERIGQMFPQGVPDNWID